MKAIAFLFLVLVFVVGCASYTYDATTGKMELEGPDLFESGLSIANSIHDAKRPNCNAKNEHQIYTMHDIKDNPVQTICVEKYPGVYQWVNK